MEQLSLYLQDYKEIVGTAAGVVTLGQVLAAGFICKDIYKKGSTDGIPSTPFIGGVVIGIMMLQYSIILNDTAMLTVNYSGIGINVAYFLFYYYYCRTKRELLKSLGIGLVFIGVLVGYAKFENQELVEHRFGLIVTIFMLILIGSPLFGVKDIIKHKDASSIPLPLVLSGTVVAFLWLLYGIILLNDYMIFQNVIGLTLSVLQLILYYMYPGPGEAKKIE